MSSICLFLCHILNQNVLISLPKTHERTLFKRLFSKNSYGGACPQTPLVLLGHRENYRFYVGAFPPPKSGNLDSCACAKCCGVLLWLFELDWLATPGLGRQMGWGRPLVSPLDLLPIN